MITIQLAKEDTALIEELTAIETANVQQIEKSNFNGQQELVDLLTTITTISLPLIANVINTALKNKKQIVIKHKGMTIQGLSEKNSTDILKKLIDKDNA